MTAGATLNDREHSVREVCRVFAPTGGGRSLRAVDAAKVTGVDRDLFNWIVHAGFYPAAPAVKKGGTRRFVMVDLVGLAVFARLEKLGMPQRKAGLVASACVGHLREHPDAVEYRYSNDDGYIAIIVNVAEIRRHIQDQMRARGW